ncbi:hypothetical protein KIN20_009366 [Parelaphostrongylus tenuis]|uniref:Uncharacterized protein n=1 Tax=Parelaphostrongylus tenuis TaxID=148309 RepID=A0AAD5M697_PARTN|nr:hypothetical protein KIN20_009366 [Parelaphostrongylus tenuis]
MGIDGQTDRRLGGCFRYRVVRTRRKAARLGHCASATDYCSRKLITGRSACGDLASQLVNCQMWMTTTWHAPGENRHLRSFLANR